MTRSMLLLLALVATVLMVATSASAGRVITSGGSLSCSFTATPDFPSFEGECGLRIEGVSDLGGPGGLCSVPRFVITTGLTTGGPFWCVTDSGSVPSPTVVTNVHCVVTFFTFGADGRLVDFDVYESFHGTIVVRNGVATGYCPAPNAP